MPSEVEGFLARLLVAILVAIVTALLAGFVFLDAFLPEDIGFTAMDVLKAAFSDILPLGK